MQSTGGDTVKAIVLPPPPSGDAFDTKYVQDAFRKITYANTRLYTSRLVDGLVTHNRPSTPQDCAKEEGYRNQRFLRLHYVSKVLRKQVNGYIDMHMSAQCAALCSAIHTTLPLELREIIYGFLLSRDQAVRIDGEVFRSDWLSKEGKPCFPPSFLPNVYAHVFKDKFASDAVRAEIAKVWYRETTLRFLAPEYYGLGDPFAHVRNFFACDRFGCGHNVRELVKSVEFSIPYSTVAGPRIYSDSSGTGNGNPFLVAQLDSGTRVTLLVTEMWVSGPLEERLFDQHGHLLQVLELLLGRGCRVWVELLGASKVEVKAEDLSGECWKDKLRLAWDSRERFIITNGDAFR